MNLNTARFSLFEHQNQHWVVTAEQNTTLEDILKPEYFANVANKMRQYDKIHVRIDTGEWYAELLVVQCGKNWAKTVATLTVEFEDSVNEDETRDGVFDLYLVKHLGPHLKWCVIRKVDKETIKGECNSKGEAQAWLASYVRSL